jgi:hypothetical protein
MNEEEHREKMIDRQWGLLAAIAQGYCQNPEFACTAYQPLADMIVRAAHAGSRDMPHDTIQGSTEASRPRRGGERKDRTNEKRQEAEGVT